MESKVKDLMIPLMEFPKVSSEATLYEAISALRHAHETMRDYTFRPRAVLVVGENNQVVGKINLWDCIRALEPKYGAIGDFRRLSHWGLNPEFIRSMVAKHNLWTDPLDTLCSKAAAMNVKDFMHQPHEDEYIPGDAKLGEAVHQLVMGRHMSLLVTEDDKVVGFLRLCDVFDYVAGKVELCSI